jgi:hypothetical protein
MTHKECFQKVGQLQNYKGTKTPKGYPVTSVIIGPTDASLIADFIASHETMGDLYAADVVRFTNDFEPWILLEKDDFVLHQKFSEAFPDA